MATFSNVVTSVIEKQLGKAAAEALGKEFFDHLTGDLDRTTPAAR